VRGCARTRLPVGEVERHVGLAEEHRAGAEQAVDDRGVPPRDVVPKSGDAPRGGETGDVVGFLDRHGHAVERTPHPPPGQGAVGRARPSARSREIAHDDGIERGVVLLDPGQIELEKLETAYLALADVTGELPGRPEWDVEHAAAATP
jgi:hypothetical protein